MDRCDVYNNNKSLKEDIKYIFNENSVSNPNFHFCIAKFLNFYQDANIIKNKILKICIIVFLVEVGNEDWAQVIVVTKPLLCGRCFQA